MNTENYVTIATVTWYDVPIRCTPTKGRKMECSTIEFAQELVKSGFRKVAQDTSGTIINAYFFNPSTGLDFTICVRDFEYDDKRRDNDELYFMPIDDVARRAWRRHKGIISVGDTVEVYKGRKVPRGTIAIVIDEYSYYDCYGRWRAHYVVLDNGAKTNIDNCRLI